MVRLRKPQEDCGCGWFKLARFYLVWVVLHSQFPVGMFDLALVSCSLHPQQLIEVPALAFDWGRHQNVLCF